MATFQPTTQSFQSGARTLPREYYVSAEVLADETERILSCAWNCVGRASAIAQPGQYVVRDIAGESIIILRDRAGGLRAFYNVCRHRGTRICTAASGRFSETIQCAYHAWTYATDGRLIGAPHMQDAEGFDKRDYPLHPAAIAEWEGFLFVSVSDAPAPFAEAFAPMIGRLTRFDLPSLAIGHSVRYEVAANWKLLFQNYSECLHCPTIHPELSLVLPYQSGANDLTEGAFLGGYMELTEGNASATVSGRACGRLVSDSLSPDDRRRAFYYSLMPNMLLSVHPDYVNYYIVTPVAPDRTIVESQWLFHPDASAAPGFHPDDAIEFWDVTNRQDWDIVERSQRGVSSRKYEPGPYSPRESIPAAWDRAYLEMMQQS